MEVDQVLHMNGGVGEASYALNSTLQKKVITMTKQINEDAIHKIHNFFPRAKCLGIADLGCSSGPNTLSTILELIKSIYKVRRELNNQSPITIQVFLNDLPGNDFNTLFKALPSFKKQLKHEIRAAGFGPCFFYGAPGSFYDRLFASQTLHFVHSSYSLHWLSQVPKSIGRSHKSNICLTSESPESVRMAYYQQFETDFSTFLRCRSEELVNGGCMVFTLLGRSDDPSIKGSAYIWEPLVLVLHHMISEGFVKEETLDLFNIPMYTPSPTEIKIEVHKEGSFELNCVQVSEIDWEAASRCKGDVDDDDESKDVLGKEAGHVGLMKIMRAVAEPMLVDHFGQGLMDEIFCRYAMALSQSMVKERLFFTNITVSLTNKLVHTND